MASGCSFDNVAERRNVSGGWVEHLIDGLRGAFLVAWNSVTVEVTGGGRIWYCIDYERRAVWMTTCPVGHPKATD